MTAPILIAGSVATFAMAAIIAGLLRAYAEKHSLIDYPNHRSAHQLPTPRGGGLGFVIGFLAALAALASVGEIDASAAVGIGGAGAIVALIGFGDDHGHIPAGWRLVVHFLAAAWLLAWLGLAPIAQLLNEAVPLPMLYTAAAVLIVWLINLYNFMDGIDGIASIESATTALGAAVIAALAGSPEIIAINVLFVAAVIGFLVWNWSPASIFMGDVGSGFLGVVSAGLSLWAAYADPLWTVAWLILLAVFVTDSGVTLLRRAFRGERLHQAHSMHGYQHAARWLRSHAKVSVSVGALNLLWLTPIAAGAVMGWLHPLVAVPIAYVPVVGLAIWLNAGRRESTGRFHTVETADLGCGASQTLREPGFDDKRRS